MEPSEKALYSKKRRRYAKLKRAEDLPPLHLYRRGKATIPMVKSRSRPPKRRNRSLTRTQPKPTVVADGSRCFSSGASRRTRAIFFFNAGSDHRLRTSPSRGYCWGLDLWMVSRRSIPPSEMLPNLFAGLQRRKASTPEGRRSLARSPQARELTFGCRRM